MPRRTRAQIDTDRQVALEAERSSQQAQWQRDWQEYLRTLSRLMETKYAERNRRINAVYNRRFLLKKPNVPSVYEETKSDIRFPFINDVCRRSAAVLGQNPPKGHVNPARLGDVGQANADLREKIKEAAFDLMMGEKHLWLKITDACPSSGMAVVKLIRDEHKITLPMRREGESAKDYNARFGEAKKASLPYTMEFVPYVSYMPVSDTERLEITEREFLPVARHFGLSIDAYGAIGFGRLGEIIGRPSVIPGTQNTSTYPSTVKVTEFWDAENYVYMVKDFVVRAGTHDYGRHPYFDAPFGVTDSMAPEDNGLSIAYPMISLQDNLDELGTRKMNWTYLAAYPGMKMKPMFEDTPPPPEGLVVVWKPGMAPWVAGHEVSWDSPPPVGSDLNQMMDMVRDVLDTIGIAPILQGFPVGANTSNAAVNSMVAVARSVFGPGVQSLAQMLDDLAKFLFQLIEKKGETLRLWHKGANKFFEIGPEDINGYYEFEHRIEPLIPAERQAKMMVMADMQSRRAITMRRLQEEGIGIEDPTTESDEIFLESLEERPTWVQLLDGQIAEKIQADPRFIQPGSPENVSQGMGGKGVPVVPGLQQGVQPGLPPAAGPENIGRG